MLLALWSPFAIAQLPDMAPSPQLLLNDVDIESREKLMTFFLRDASLTWQLEQFFRRDPVDLPWAAATEQGLIESEIRYGSFVGESMTVRYSDTYRDIAQRGIGSVFRPDGGPRQPRTLTRRPHA